MRHILSDSGIKLAPLTRGDIMEHPVIMGHAANRNGVIRAAQGTGQTADASADPLTEPQFKTAEKRSQRQGSYSKAAAPVRL